MSNNRLKIAFWGTPDFAIPPLEALIKNSYNVVAVITNPDEHVGRKKTLTPPPVKGFAEKHDIPVFQPKNRLEIENLKLEIPAAELYIVAAYGKIIPKEFLKIPKYGALNLHPSLLPRWRGPSPIQYTILNGDTKTGVTVIKIDEEMDHGPIVTQRRLETLNSKFKTLSKSKIQIQEMTYQKLHNELAKLGAQLLIETIPAYVTGQIMPRPQDESKVTYSKILKKDDGRIDWKKTAEDIERLVRAFTPWPGAWTMWQDKRIRIDEAHVSQENAPDVTPGEVWKTADGKLFIQTGKGSIVVKLLTLEGKKAVDAAAFLRGHPSIEKATLA